MDRSHWAYTRNKNGKIITTYESSGASIGHDSMFKLGLLWVLILAVLGGAFIACTIK